MTWFTWRQFRTQAAVSAAAVLAFGIVLLVTGPGIAEMYADVAACRTNCESVVSGFLSRVDDSAAGTLYHASLAVMYTMPALIGIFWGAPLVARELEAGTHGLAWNQAVTRTRWLATKLLVLGAAAAALGGLLSLAVTGWARHIDSAAADRITPLVYGARGIVPVGYAVFGFVLGVTAGMLIRRTMPAMAATLAGYVAAVAPMPLWIRAHLVPARHETPALDLDRMDFVGIRTDGRMDVLGEDLPNTWTVVNRTTTPGGQLFTGPADPTACGRDTPVQGCEAWLRGLGLRQEVVYHPDSHFWSLQWIETGIFLALAVLLAGICFWWVRRRIT
ncbi:ABC transporter permease [Plantactinospora sonchi]|uniref:ABC transporter permease n=1 Tax=Plantactinospora sonchi TaxID=1544735 RepID=A0ABU7RTB8_9ACTN